MPERRAARRNTLVVTVSAVSVVVCVTLFWVYNHQAGERDKRTRAMLRAATQRLDDATAANAAAIVKSCRLTNAARAQSNAQIRKPLKAMLAYFVTLVDTTLKEQSAAGKPIPNLERALDFKAKFEDFRDRVKVLPPLNCRKPTGVR